MLPSTGSSIVLSEPHESLDEKSPLYVLWNIQGDMIMQQDKRTIKTERVIRRSFLELLEKKDFSRITINDICDRACISRNTFYAHYADKYLLMDRITEDFFQDLLSQIINKNVDNNYQSAISTTAWLFFDYLSEHQSVVRLLSKSNSQFWSILDRQLQEYTLSVSPDNPKAQVYAIYSCGAITGCYRAFFEGSIAMSSADFVQSVIDIAGKSNDYLIKKL